MIDRPVVWSIDMDTPRRPYGWRFILGAIAVFAIWYFFLQPHSEELTASEQAALLQMAREQLVSTASGGDMMAIEQSVLSESLVRDRSAFVSLSIDGELRGCMIDSFEPHEPLYWNVLRNTVLAASQDERFPAVKPEEVERIRIAISILTEPKEVVFSAPGELIAALTPLVDGVILTVDGAIASYLPHVWIQFPEPDGFLSHLCEKAGVAPDRWRVQPYPRIETYGAFRFEEPE